MKQRLIAFALFAVMILGGALATGGRALAGDGRTLRIASEGAFAPWNATDPSGKLIGFEIDLANDLCRRMAVSCQLVAQDWDGMIPALQQGRIDAIMAGMMITEARSKVIAFAGPYASEPSSFAAATTSDLARLPAGGGVVDLEALAPKAPLPADLATLAEALKGRTVGVQVSTVQASFMATLLPGVATRAYDKIVNAGIDMAAGRIDALFADLSVAQAIAKDNPAFTLVGPAVARGVLGHGVGVGLRKSDADLKARFDTAIAQAAADGAIARLSAQWFGHDVSIKESLAKAP